MKKIMLLLILNTISCSSFKDKYIQCANDQIELYNDLCAESRQCEGFEDGPECTDKEADKRGFGSLLIENHFEGVKCAAESIKWCIEE